MFSKKATKIDEIFTVDLTLCSKRQIDGEDFFNFSGLLRKYKPYCPNNYPYCISPSSVFLERQRPFWCCVGLMANFDKQMSTWRRDPEKSEFLANKVTCPFCRGRKNCCENCGVFLGSNLSSYLGGEEEKDVFCTKLGQGFTHAQDFLETYLLWGWV